MIRARYLVFRVLYAGATSAPTLKKICYACEYIWMEHVGALNIINNVENNVLNYIREHTDILKQINICY